MENSKIEWCEHTWSPWRGCVKVSAGCANCYADTMSKRNPLVLGVWGANGTRVLAANWADPVKWNKKAGDALEAWTRPRVFPSLCDSFEDWGGTMTSHRGKPLGIEAGDFLRSSPEILAKLPDGRPVVEYLEGTPHDPLTLNHARLMFVDLINNTPELDWLVLTKRPQNVMRMLADVGQHVDHYKAGEYSKAWNSSVWLGTSCEDQAAADERIPHLLNTPAKVRFLSCEPLLGPLNIAQYLRCESCLSPETCWCLDARVNWVIVGGESGPGARPCNVAWVRSIVEQCKAAGVPVFVKQLGAVPQTKSPSFDERDMWTLPLRDNKGGDWAEWPADLRVRELPAVRV